jgi:hypothetical protein
LSKDLCIEINILHSLSIFFRLVGESFIE